MTLDPYSPCPAGTGKKLKFCCADLTGELDKINRMLEGEQRLGALEHIERIEAKFPDRLCLLTTKALIQSQLGEIEASAKTLARALEVDPNNPVALAQSAMQIAALEGAHAGALRLQRALTNAGDEVPVLVYQTIGIVAQVMLSEGQPLAARAHLVLQSRMNPKDPEPTSYLGQINRSPAIPFLLKDDFRWSPPPEGEKWKGKFTAAWELAQRGQWAEAEQGFAELSKQVSDSPAIWRNLALARSYLADEEHAPEAWSKLAEICASPEEAAEAEALGRLVASPEMQDVVEMVRVEYPITDIERLLAQLGSDRRLQPVPVDPRRMENEDEPPPRSAYLLLDRPQARSAAELTFETIPIVLGQLLVYGRQTDREARLDLVAYEGQDTDAAKKTLAEVAGATIGPAGETEMVEQMPRLRWLMSPQWRLPDDTRPEQLQPWLLTHRRKALLERWADMSSVALGDRTPRQAAAIPELRNRVAGMILINELASQQQRNDIDFDPLRRELGVPVPATVDPWQAKVDQLSIARLNRVMLEKLTDDDLVTLYARAAMVQAVSALVRLAREVISRDTLDKKVDKAEAYGILASLEADPREAIQLIDKARTMAEKQGQSSARWDLEELSLHLELGEGEEVGRLLNHVSTEHINEPGVRQNLMQLLMSAGLIGPDGRPVAGLPTGAAPGPAAAAPAAEAGKLWTPGGESQAAPGSKSSIWVPGMD